MRLLKMFYRILPDIVFLIHFAFIIFVIFGGFLVLRRRWLLWFHIPCAIWGALIEFAGWICPLTPLENHFRMKGGAAGYQSGFIEHYIVPIIYPDELTRSLQSMFGLMVLTMNMCIYGWMIYKQFLKRR
jgi:hypothetical protein